MGNIYCGELPEPPKVKQFVYTASKLYFRIQHFSRIHRRGYFSQAKYTTGNPKSYINSKLGQDPSSEIFSQQLPSTFRAFLLTKQRARKLMQYNSHGRIQESWLVIQTPPLPPPSPLPSRFFPSSPLLFSPLLPLPSLTSRPLKSS